ncbi:hypothetical protein ACHWQZ_G012381 [Mnemiopsis leidyi]
MTQQEFMDIFNENGLTWYFTYDTTRRRLVKETLQESLLDQVLYTNDALVNGCKIVSPLGRSDHVGIMVDLVVSPSADTSVKQKVLKPIWGKVSSEKLLNISINDIIWDYSSTNNVQDMWAELHCKLEAVAATVPAASVYLDNRPVKLPWSSTALKRMRKNKDRAWAEFDIDPSDINLSNAMSKQHTFEEEEFKAKVSYEKKITSDLKHNSKAFYAYLRNKRQVKSSVVSLDRRDGTRTDTSAEAAEVLATAFSSVFVHEPPESILAAHGNWATVLELESVQRRFTRLIDEVGTLPYSRRLEILNLTTLAERRIRGDLIEAFKATSGLTDYGQMDADKVEREKRRSNVVVLSAPEPEKEASAEQKKKEDKDFCSKVLGIPLKDVETCWRAGKIDNSKPDYLRPLVIKLKSEGLVQEWTKEGKGYKTESGFWINKDLCAADRKANFLAREQRRTRLQKK